MKTRLRTIRRSLLTWTAILFAWEGAFRLHLLSPLIFSSPSLVLKAAWTDAGAFTDAFCTSAFEILIATAIAWSAGILFGTFAGSMRVLARISTPLLSAMIALPFVIIYPVLTAWFGIGSESKIIFGVLLGLFPIALNTMIGVQAIEPGYFIMARSLGASRLQALTQVLVPLALPSVIAGLRLGTSLIIVGVILTEMLASTGGLGFLITYHRALFDTGDVVLGIILGMVISFAASEVLSWIENRCGGWRAMQQELVEKQNGR